LLEENLGKTLGQYATDWGARAMNLIVIDEVIPRNAQYVSIGRMHGQVVPVSSFGLRETP
jgi:ethanolamine utilization protein EutA